MELDAVSWPASRLGELLATLATHAGMIDSTRTTPVAPVPAEGERDGAPSSRLVTVLARQLGVEAEAVSVTRHTLSEFVRRGAPAIVATPDRPDRLLGLAGGGSRRVLVVCPDGHARRIGVDAVVDVLRVSTALPNDDEEDLLRAAGVPHAALSQAKTLTPRHAASGPTAIAQAWILRLSPGAELSRHRSHSRLVARMGRLLAAHAVQYALWIISWLLIGRAALGHGTDRGLLAFWGLLLVAIALLRTWIERTAGRMSIDGGAWLKRRLLVGALRLRPAEVRHEGAGHLFGRVSESEALETLGVGGGLLAALAVVELVLSSFVLAVGAGGLLSVGVLATVVGSAVLLTLRYRRAQADWTRARLSITGEVVEKMVGRRTVVAQAPRSEWHRGEDESLVAYAAASRRMDTLAAFLVAGVPRVQLAAGIAALMPSFVAGGSPTSLAIGLGGTLLANQALVRITLALSQLIGASAALSEAGPLLDAAARPAAPAGASASEWSDATPRQIVLAEGLTYRHEDRGDSALRGVSVTIRRGDRIILEGASGSGKSTLASILAGLREPDSGVLLVGGLDRHTVHPRTWRRRVALVPQFHENHLFSGTLAFNLLMGRRWPPLPDDLAVAEEICREIGLGPLLDRMPSGMQQTIGESGWQLSHGEKSRLFVARALLQEPELVVLDESLGALDPETAGELMDCVSARASAVMVIAHE